MSDHEGSMVGSVDAAIDRLAVRARTWWDTLLQHTLVLHLLSLVVAAGILIYTGRRQWFFNDEWDPIAQRTAFGGHGNMGWLDGHGEHPVLIPSLLWRGVIAVFGLDSYLPFILMVIVAQLLLAHLLWRMMLKVGIRPLVATVAAALFAVCGAAYENLLWAFQIALILPLVFGVLALLLLPERGPVGLRDVAATGLGVLAWMSSGVGLPIIVMIAGTSMLRRRWVAGLVQLLIPLGTYGLWTLRYAGDSLGQGQTLSAGVRSIPGFTFSGLVHAYGDFVGSTALGPVVLAATAIGLVIVCRRPLGALLPVVTMFGAGVLFLALTAVRRSDLGGFDSGGGSRYFHIVLALGLPAMALVVDRALRLRPLTLPALVVVGLLGIVQVDTLLDQSAGWAERSAGSRDTIMAAAEQIHDGALLFPGTVEPQWAPGLSVADLEDLVEQGTLTPRSTPEPVMLAAQNSLQIAVAAADDPALEAQLDGLADDSIQWLGSTGVTSVPNGTAECRAITADQNAATVTLLVTAPSVTEVSADVAQAVSVQTATDPSVAAISPARALVLPAGRSDLALTATGRTVVLTLPLGAEFELCGLSAG